MRCIFFTEQSFTDQCFCRLCNQFLPKKLRFFLQRHKTAKSCAFCDCTPEFYGGILFLLLESKGNCAFKKASKDKGEAFWHLNRPLLCKRHVPKPGNSAYAEFWDGLPVLALELGTLFTNSAQAGFVGFGSGLLVRQGFLGAQAEFLG